MKNLITATLCSLVLFASCQSSGSRFDSDSSSSSSSSDEDGPKQKKISKRDYSITKENAFNNVFLDSMAVEDFLSKNNIPDSVSRRVRSFYNTRNYQYAWFNTGGLTEQALGFWCLKNYSGDTAGKSKQFQKRMDALMNDEDLTIGATDKSMRSTELELTLNLIDYTRTNYEKGYVKRKEMERFIPFKKVDPLYLSDSLLNKKHKDDKYFADINESYKLLKDQLDKYTTIARNGGWPELSKDLKAYKEGKSSPDIISMKRLLYLTGDAAVADTTDRINDTLKNGIKNFQTRYGYTADGKLSASLLKEMNVSAVDRVKQILINMNRMRWMPQEPDGKLILVNIP
ncbi:MAG: hypothetical protein ABIR19_09450, partial [Ginsengibacter sp.]